MSEIENEKSNIKQNSAAKILSSLNQNNKRPRDYPEDIDPLVNHLKQEYAKQSKQPKIVSSKPSRVNVRKESVEKLIQAIAERKNSLKLFREHVNRRKHTFLSEYVVGLASYQAQTHDLVKGTPFLLFVLQYHDVDLANEIFKFAGVTGSKTIFENIINYINQNKEGFLQYKETVTTLYEQFKSRLSSDDTITTMTSLSTSSSSSLSYSDNNLNRSASIQESKVEQNPALSLPLEQSSVGTYSQSNALTSKTNYSNQNASASSSNSRETTEHSDSPMDSTTLKYLGEYFSKLSKAALTLADQTEKAENNDLQIDVSSSSNHISNH